MARCAIRMRPTRWSQYISRSDKIKVVGWQLLASCHAEDANSNSARSNLRLTSGERIQDVTVHLEFDSGEPTDATNAPLYNAIGCLQHDVGWLSGWVSLKSRDFSEVWEQVRQGGYTDCLIDISVQPVEFLGEDTGWEWDVVNHQVIYITDAAVQFVRTTVRKKLEQNKKKRSWFGFGSSAVGSPNKI